MKPINRSKLFINVMSLCVATAISLGAATTANAAIPTPDNDPFYKPPAGFAELPNGTVLHDRKINAEFLLPIFSTSVISGIASALGADKIDLLKNLKINAYQVLYKSVDSHNQPVADVATVLTPQGPWIGAGSRPLVAYQSAENSLSTRCAPSYTIRTGLLGQGALSISNYDIAESFAALLEGYAIVFPDHEGPRSEWIAGPQSGHAVLDGVRAVLHYAPAGLSADTPVGLYGYSGGGGATGWAAALKPSYAPELNVVGMALGAPSNADVTQMYRNLNGKLTSGFLVMAIVGLDRAYPEAGIMDYLNAAGKDLVAGAQDLCGSEGLLKYPLIGQIERYTIAPDVPLDKSAPGKLIFGPNSLVNQPFAPDFPVLSYHDEFDEIVPVKAGNDLAQQYCRAGVPVEVMRTATPVPLVGLVHVAGEIEGTLPALGFLTNRFRGVPIRNDCGALAQAIWASPLPLPYFPLLTQ